MLIGVVAFFPDNEILNRKYFGMSPIENFARIREEYDDIPFVLLAENETTFKALNAVYEDSLLCKRNELQSKVSACSSYLAGKKELTVARIAKESYSAIPEIYCVFSDENDRINQDMLPSLQWFEDFNVCVCNPTAFKHSFRIYINGKLEENGVIFMDINTAYIDATVRIGAGSIIYPNVYLEGNTVIGENTVIYPGCRVVDTTVGSNCSLQYVVANESCVGDNVSIGPFVNLRPNTVIADNCKIGDFVEVKNSNIGTGSKLPHLSYIGDADVGSGVNVGCGTVFVNYNGRHKLRTIVGDRVFIGCNTNLVAPVSVGDDVFVAAGSTITDDVPAGSMAIARARQTNKDNWVHPEDREKE